MKQLLFIASITLLGACGSKQQQPVSNAGSADDSPGVVQDTRTELEKRRDAGCEQLQPTLTECAIADAKKSLSKEEYAKLKPDELRAKHKQEFLKECTGSSMSSRQVRVLEVCHREEKECDPLAECLKNLQPESK